MTDKQSADEWLAQRIYLLISAASIQPTEAELEAFAEEFHKRKLAEQPQATHKITACYFPGKGEVELTWKDVETGEVAALTALVSTRQGEQIAKVVMPCVYQDATAEQPSFESRCAEVLRGVVMKYWPKDNRATQYELDELYRKIGVKMCSVMKQLESEASDER